MPKKGLDASGRITVEAGFVAGFGEDAAYAYAVAEGPLDARNDWEWTDFNAQVVDLPPGASVKVVRWLVVGSPTRSRRCTRRWRRCARRAGPRCRDASSRRRRGEPLAGARVFFDDREGPMAMTRSTARATACCCRRATIACAPRASAARGPAELDVTVGDSDRRVARRHHVASKGTLAYRVQENGAPLPARLTILGVAPTRDPHLGPAVRRARQQPRRQRRPASARWRCRRGTIACSRRAGRSTRSTKRASTSPPARPRRRRSSSSARSTRSAGAASICISTPRRRPTRRCRSSIARRRTWPRGSTSWSPPITTPSPPTGRRRSHSCTRARPLSVIVGDEVSLERFGHFSVIPVPPVPPAPHGGAPDVRGHAPRRRGARARRRRTASSSSIIRARAGAPATSRTSGSTSKSAAARGRAASTPSRSSAARTRRASSRRCATGCRCSIAALAHRRRWQRLAPHRRARGRLAAHVHSARRERGARRRRAVSALKKRHEALVTNGPFVRVSVAGHGMGQLAPAPRGRAKLDIEIEAAPWIDVRRLELFINGLRRGKPIDVPQSQKVQRYKGVDRSARRARRLRRGRRARRPARRSAAGGGRAVGADGARHHQSRFISTATVTGAGRPQTLPPRSRRRPCAASLFSFARWRRRRRRRRRASTSGSCRRLRARRPRASPRRICRRATPAPGASSNAPASRPSVTAWSCAIGSCIAACR